MSDPAGPIMRPSDDTRAMSATAKNAEFASNDLRAQIDHQLVTADRADTKAAAVIAATGVLIGLVAGHVVLDTLPRQISAAAALLFSVLAVLLAIRASRPRPGFSFGVEARDLASQLKYGTTEWLEEFVRALADAKRKNDEALGSKHRELELTYWYFLAIVISIAAMIATGAVR